MAFGGNGFNAAQEEAKLQNCMNSRRARRETAGPLVSPEEMSGEVDATRRRAAVRRYLHQMEEPADPTMRSRPYFHDVGFNSEDLCNGSYRIDYATMEPTNLDECARLAKHLVWYGEVGTLTTVRGSYVKWTASGPAGPPMLQDLIPGCTYGATYREDVAKPAEYLLRRRGRQGCLGGKCVGDPPIVKYARSSNLAMVQALLAAGAKLEDALEWEEDDERAYGSKEWTWKGDTALMAAAREGHVGMVKFLLERGANRNHKCCYMENKFDKSCAAAAWRSGNKNGVAILIEPNSVPGPPNAQPDPAKNQDWGTKRKDRPTSTGTCSSCKKSDAASTCPNSRCGKCCTGCTRHKK